MALQTARLIAGCTLQHSLKGKEYMFCTSLAASYRSAIYFLFDTMLTCFNGAYAAIISVGCFSEINALGRYLV